MRVLIALVLVGCAIPSTRSQSLEDVFTRVQSAVVTVRTDSREVDIVVGGGLTSVAGIGSGVLISDQGDIMTAAHVVHTADRVEVEFADGTVLEADVISSDPLNDVALIRLKNPIPAGVHVAKVGDSDLAKVGRRVFVVGAPFGISHTLTVGHISARRQPDRGVRTLFDAELFQTDAAINTGNSGGPMFDIDGEVIGIVSHIVSTSGGSEGLGFAVTSNVARKILLESPPIWSGIDMVLVTGSVARVLNVPGGFGMLIQHVAKGSMGERMGLRGGNLAASVGSEHFVAGGDIVLTVQGIPVDTQKNLEQIRDTMRALQNGDPIELSVLRDGEVQILRSRFKR